MLEAIVGLLGLSFFGILGWVISVNARVAVLEQRDCDYKELINVQFTAVNQRLDRIEKAMNGYIKGH